MSFQAQNWANQQKTGHISGRAILMTLANFADENGYCYPSQSRLAEDCECSERTIRQWLDKLEELGFISRIRRNREDGSRTSDLIRLNMGENLPANSAARDKSLPANSAASNGSLPANFSKSTGKICRVISKVNLSEDIMSETSSDTPDTPHPKKRQTYPELFEETWKEYPTDANMSKKEAFNEWKKLSEEDKQAVKAAIPPFKAFCAKDRTYRPIHMCRFISKERWKGHLNQIQASPPTTDIPDRKWETFLNYGRTTHEWREDILGPAPHKAGCRVPQHLLLPTDGENWRSLNLTTGEAA